MRPVNLIPSDQRRDKVQIRTGPIAYLLVGALALGLAAMTMVVLTNNKIADRKAEIADLNQQKTAIEAQAGQLKPFIDFKQAEQKRVETIRSLANRRFDWDRVMRELSLVLPDDVSLTTLTASVAGAADAGGTTATDSGPNLQMTGCARSHDAVAGFLATLQDIDGVTSVDLQSSERGETTPGSSSTEGGSGSDCGPTVKFQLTAAFEGANGAQGSAVPSPATPSSTASSTATAPADSSAATVPGS
jgi:Tfp pilus assembly protein PilN